MVFVSITACFDDDITTVPGCIYVQTLPDNITIVGINYFRIIKSKKCMYLLLSLY